MSYISDFQTFWFQQGPFLLFNITEDPKEFLFIYFSSDTYHITNENLNIY